MRSSYAAMMSSPVGDLWICVTDEGLCAINFGEPGKSLFRKLHRYGVALPEDAEHPLLYRAVSQLSEYFEGTRSVFDLPLELLGTPFQKSIWDVLLTIPLGQTSTYGTIAAALGRPSAARAVGQAVGSNKINIVVPCHRVLGHDGSLTGYGGGIERKFQLLQLEGILLDV